MFPMEICQRDSGHLLTWRENRVIVCEPLVCHLLAESSVDADADYALQCGLFGTCDISDLPLGHTSSKLPILSFVMFDVESQLCPHAIT